MRANLSFVAGIAMLIPAIAVHAQESLTTQAVRHSAPRGVSEAFFACVDRSGSDQGQIASCISMEEKIQDRRLNKAYATLMGHLGDKAKESVKAAERAWIDFNDKSVVAETAIGATNQTNDLDVEQAELFRYCEQANVLERYVFATGN